MSYLGPAIKDGVLRYTSPSAIQKFANPEDGCERQYGFRYILGLKQPTTPPQQRGIDGHARIEHHLKTGETTLTDLERPGLIWIPRERDKIWVEPEIGIEYPLAVVAGVPLIGKLDCVDFSGRYVDPQGGVHAQGYPEIDDWKYSGDPRKWAKTADKIRDDLAMNAYALWAWQRLPGDEARLSHVYFATKRPDSFKRTAVVDKEHANRIVQSYEPVVERMRVAARVKDPNDLEPNYNACSAYTGCPYQARCDRPLEAVVRMTLGVNKSATPATEEKLMSMLEQMTGNTQPPAAPLTAENAAPSDSMEEKIAKLEQAEREAEHATAPPVAAAPEPPAPPPAEPAADWDGMLRAIKSYGIGSPTYAADAAQAVAAVYKWTDVDPGSAIGGSGALGAVNVRTLDDMKNMLVELAEKFPDPSQAAAQLAAAKSAAAPPQPATAPEGTPSALPPGATLPRPHEAADPLPPEHSLDLSGAVKAEVEAHRAQHAAANPAPPKSPGRPASNLPAARFKKLSKGKVVGMLMGLMTKLGIDDVDAIESYAPTTGGPADDDTRARLAEFEKGSVTQARYDELAAKFAAAGSSDSEKIAELESALTESRKREKAWADAYEPLKAECEKLRASGPGDGPEISLWVDCLPNDLAVTPLDEYVDDVMLKVAECGSAPHMFAADDKSIIAFGKWRGWLDQVVQQEKPPAGNYYLRTGKDEVRESVVNALRKYHGARVHRGIA